MDEPWCFRCITRVEHLRLKGLIVVFETGGGPDFCAKGHEAVRFWSIATSNDWQLLAVLGLF
ncbi:hypothetical protein PSEUDO8BK_190016 [Pseudomonas sp. 8BK]|nr:hypothetical protein PSEUDO8BK_190016 [Pseudomonas sp. 8BK]